MANPLQELKIGHTFQYIVYSINQNIELKVLQNQKWKQSEDT